ncbi:hypothetical protein QYF61_018384 [Mycteria americana]|uniref:Uncharacterized protein n=1 Tax=Mycteria americana TaxID=33587 RepID=A0AAN7MBJ2_MYCAM|nr:hypothetical protein QYF61_018384 [Mycteria americana]
MGLLWPKCRTLHLALLNLIQLTSAHRSSLSRSLCRAFLPSSRSTLPHNLVSSANLLRVHSIPSSRSLIKILNRTGPNTEPWGTPLVTGHQLDLTPVTTTLWARPSSQFFTQNIKSEVSVLVNIEKGILTRDGEENRKGESEKTHGSRCQKLPPCPIEPVPAGSKMDPPLAKAEPTSDSGSASVIIYLRRGKNCCTTAAERGVRICERNNYADTKVSEEGGGGGAPGTGAEIPLQPMVKTMLEQVDVPKGGLVTPWRTHAAAASWQDLWARGGPMLEQCCGLTPASN